MTRFLASASALLLFLPGCFDDKDPEDTGTTSTTETTEPTTTTETGTTETGFDGFDCSLQEDPCFEQMCQACVDACGTDCVSLDIYPSEYSCDSGEGYWDVWDFCPDWSIYSETGYY